MYIFLYDEIFNLVLAINIYLNVPKFLFANICEKCIITLPKKNCYIFVNVLFHDNSYRLLKSSDFLYSM